MRKEKTSSKYVGNDLKRGREMEREDKIVDTPFDWDEQVST